MSLRPTPESDSSTGLAGEMRIAPLTREHALDICTWRYDAPDECYDMTDADPDWLVQPESGFHALLAGDQLIGFRSLGPDGQVPGWAYDDTALDTGGGLRPDLVGRGLGRHAISTGPGVRSSTVRAGGVPRHCGDVQPACPSYRGSSWFPALRSVLRRDRREQLRGARSPGVTAGARR